MTKKESPTREQLHALEDEAGMIPRLYVLETACGQHHVLEVCSQTLEQYGYKNYRLASETERLIIEKTDAPRKSIDGEGLKVLAAPPEKKVVVTPIMPETEQTPQKPSKPVKRPSYVDASTVYVYKDRPVGTHVPITEAEGVDEQKIRMETGKKKKRGFNKGIVDERGTH